MAWHAFYTLRTNERVKKSPSVTDLVFCPFYLSCIPGNYCTIVVYLISRAVFYGAQNRRSEPSRVWFISRPVFPDSEWLSGRSKSGLYCTFKERVACREGCSHPWSSHEVHDDTWPIAASACCISRGHVALKPLLVARHGPFRGTAFLWSHTGELSECTSSDFRV